METLRVCRTGPWSGEELRVEPKAAQGGGGITAAVERSPGASGAAVGLAVVLAVATLIDFGLTANGLLWAAVQVVLVFIAWFDVLERRILNVVVVPVAVASLALRLIFEHGVLLECIGAGAIAFAVFYVLALIARGGLGMGDVKLAALIGLLLGWQAAYALMLAAVAGGIAAALILASGRGSRKSSYAYGPYLALGAVVLILVGSPPPLV